MSYFKNAKKSEEVYGMIFGRGIIVDILPDSYYSIMVEFDNGYEIPYTIEGVPSWGNFEEQTMFYRQDIDLSTQDFAPLHEILLPKEIASLRKQGKLDVRLPSGIWKNIAQVEENYAETLLEKKKYHLFRKSQ
jgi:hypothetical protein